MRTKRLAAALLAIGLVATACGDDKGGVFDAGTSSSSSAGQTTTTGGTPATAETTTTTAILGPVEFLATTEFAPSGDPPPSLVGTPDFAGAEAIAADLEAQGADLTGVDVWVFPVVGSDERLLTFEVNPSAAGLAEDPTGESLLDLLATSPSVAEAGVTRFVLNYYDNDENGAFVLTTTLPLDKLFESIDEGTDVSDHVAIQIKRVDGTAASPTDTTTPPAPDPPPDDAVLTDAFDGSTPVTPLFDPGVLSAVVTAEEVLEMRVFATGVIPAMYPDPLPEGVEISFDFQPQPNESTASFGALVLSEEPADGALEHYVAVWANPSDGLLTVIPWDAATGGWGVATVESIPAGIGFSADRWFTMRLEVVDGTVEVFIDDVFVAFWEGATPVTSGHWGPVVIGAAPGDGMLVDNVRVDGVGS